jgi:DNA-binding Lrp family transcriptional regulator
MSELPPMKWVQELATTAVSGDEIEAALKGRGLSEKTVKDQMRRLALKGLIPGQTARVEKFKPVPKPGQKERP